MRSLIILLLATGLLIISAAPRKPNRIVGGSVTTIEAYPYTAAMLHTWNLVDYWQACGGTIINQRSILSAAHCFYRDAANRWRIRVGSTWANSDGVVYSIALIINHSDYNPYTVDNDISVLRSSTNFVISDTILAASIAGPNYVLPDNEPVTAVGWGATSVNGPSSEQLRHVEVWTVNHSICKQRYADIRLTVTENMLCSGWLDVGGRDQCQGDSGGPLIHNNVIVGICSWGEQCALSRYPGVNTRVSRFTAWIQANA
ncbi:trypsin CFT-1-like [Battus philenor]